MSAPLSAAGAAVAICLPDEQWKFIEGFGRYLVSNFGRVASLKSGRAVAMKGGASTTKMRYRRVTLVRDDGKKISAYLHVLVAVAFVPDRSAGPWVLHKDGDVADCRAANLYWGTPEQNSRDRIRHGRSGVGAANPNAKLTEDRVAQMRASYRAGGVTQAHLAAQFGVEQAHVSRILRGASWSKTMREVA